MTNAFRPGERVKARHPEDHAFYPAVIEKFETERCDPDIPNLMVATLRALAFALIVAG
jgi:hypothetical protein